MTKAVTTGKDAMIALDALDHKIIAVLQDNARLPNAEVAAQVGSSEPTVRRRVDRLLRHEVIKIVAVAPPLQLGYQVVAILGIQIDHSHLSAIEQALYAMPEIRFGGRDPGQLRRRRGGLVSQQRRTLDVFAHAPQPNTRRTAH